MPNRSTYPEKLRKLYDPAALAIILTFLYWIYLAFNSSMYIVFDAMLYEKFGNMIYKDGWREFLRTGPHNEPLYPFLISISMRLADMFSVSYQNIQKIFQIAILFLTQILMLELFKKLNINRFIAAGTILYFGISPAIVNSALSLWSEIVTYPFVLGIVLVGTAAQRAITQESMQRAISLGLIFGLLFAGITFAKAIFQAIFLIFIFFFLMIMLIEHTKKSKAALKNSLLFTATALVFYHLCILPFMFANLHFNNHLTIADRGPWIVYGKTAKRAEKINAKGLLAGISYGAGEGVCKKIFGEAECFEWSPAAVDRLGLSKMEELKKQGLSGRETDKILLEQALTKIKERPFQYILLMGVESLKMFFWESTKIGYVKYPPWLERAYEMGPMKDGLRFLLSFLTAFSFFYTCLALARKKILSSVQAEASRPILFFILVFLIIYSVMYSFFFIVPRHAFAIVPLYLTLIAFFTQNLFLKHLSYDQKTTK